VPRGFRSEIINALKKLSFSRAVINCWSGREGTVQLSTELNLEA